MEVTNKFIVMKAQIEGSPQESDFELKTELLSLSILSGSKDVIVNNIYVSIDPYQLNRMKSYSSSQKASEFSGRVNPEEVNRIGILSFVLSMII